MRIFLTILTILGHQFSLTNAEFKICATVKNSNECKLIEASRKDVKCVYVTDSVNCVVKFQKGQVDLGTFDPEELLIASHFIDDKANVIAEIRNPERLDHHFEFQTAVVVKSNFKGGLTALKNTKYCHHGFDRSHIWTDNVLKHFESKLLQSNRNIIDCSDNRSALENELYGLSKIFSKACRPGEWTLNEWTDRHLKRNYASLCAQCDNPSTCKYSSPGRNDDLGALRCLTIGAGDVAYTALGYVREYFNLNNSPYYNPVTSGFNSSDYRFLCDDGTTRELSLPGLACTWTKQPWTSVIALKSKSANLTAYLRSWLPKEIRRGDSWGSNLKSIITQDKGEIVMLDESTSLSNHVKRGRDLPSNESSCRRALRWCTINDTEDEKCGFVRIAAKTHGVPSDIKCVRAADKHDCMEKIQKNEADFVYIDTNLGFIARKVYNLTARAFLETDRTGNYLGIMVVKKGTYSKIQELKNKKACFPQYNGLGWLSFVHTVKNLSLVPTKLCSDTRAVWEFFSDACAPGALDSKVNYATQIEGVELPTNLCSGCKGRNSNSSCEAKTKNPYYGEVGALRCLNSGDGNVAFLDFNTIKNFFQSDRHDTPDSAIKPENFDILCRDGSKANFNDLQNPEDCAITQFNGGEIVSRSSLSQSERSDILTTLLKIDYLFGTTSHNPVIRIYEPYNDDKNVLFKESAVQLVSVYETQGVFVHNYVELQKEMDYCYKENSGSILLGSVLMTLLSIIIIFYDKY